MKATDERNGDLLCPSAPPTDPGAVVFGVVTGTPERRRIGYLTEALPVTRPMLALAGEANPGQVFRVATTCAGGGCKHFDGADCRLAQRITAFLDPVVSGLPACGIRPTCRWFRQEGKAACLRCPQVVTDATATNDRERWIADPDNAPAAPGEPDAASHPVLGG